MAKVSVVICTYNREDMLEIALESLTKQEVSASDFEVIVVDNNSKDNTKAVAEKFIAANSHFRYVLETNQGLSHARNRGGNEASTDFVAYMDDDAKAPANWVKQLIEIIDDKKPDIFGGPIYPFYLQEKPNWFDDELEIRLHQKHTGFMMMGHISGSNFIIKKSVLLKHDGFNVNLGMSGEALAYGEESDLLDRVRKAGGSIYYDVDLIMEHFVPAMKMNVPYWLVANFRKGMSRGAYVSDLEEVSAGSGLASIEHTISEVEKALKNPDVLGGKSIESFMISHMARDFWNAGIAYKLYLEENKLDAKNIRPSAIYSTFDGELRNGKKISFFNLIRGLFGVTFVWLKSLVRRRRG